MLTNDYFIRIKNLYGHILKTLQNLAPNAASDVNNSAYESESLEVPPLLREYLLLPSSFSYRLFGGRPIQ